MALNLPQPASSGERGAVLLLFCAMLPLFLLAVFFASHLALVLKQHQRTQHVCRQGALAIQTRLLEHGETLVRLNSRAKSLNRQLKRTRHPAAAAIIYAMIGVLTIEQQALFTLAAAESRTSTETTRIKMRQSIAENLHSRFSAGTSFFTSSALTVNLSLVRDYSHVPAAVYKYPPNFSDAQTFEIDWKWRLFSVLPPWLVRFFSFGSGPTDLWIPRTCGSKPYKENSKWEVRFSEGKRRSNSSSAFF